MDPDVCERFLRRRKNKRLVLKALPFIALVFMSISVGLSSLFFWLASSSDERLAKESIRNQLIDPRSAIFGQFVRSGNRACLTVNSKNRMGGYVGDRLVLLMKIDVGDLVNPWPALIKDEDESTDFDCQLWLRPSSWLGRLFPPFPTIPRFILVWACASSAIPKLSLATIAFVELLAF